MCVLRWQRKRGRSLNTRFSPPSARCWGTEKLPGPFPLRCVRTRALKRDHRGVAFCNIRLPRSCLAWGKGGVRMGWVSALSTGAIGKEHLGWRDKNTSKICQAIYWCDDGRGSFLTLLRISHWLLVQVQPFCMFHFMAVQSRGGGSSVPLYDLLTWSL